MESSDGGVKVGGVKTTCQAKCWWGEVRVESKAKCKEEKERWEAWKKRWEFASQSLF
jgi:hypothetical protein